MAGGEPGMGSAITGDWVTNGLLSYSQDGGSGHSACANKTLALITIAGLAN